MRKLRFAGCACALIATAIPVFVAAQVTSGAPATSSTVQPAPGGGGAGPAQIGIPSIQNAAALPGSGLGVAGLQSADTVAREGSPATPRPLQPAAPNEFQRFVAATTGQALPIFGDAFFTTPSSTFAPVERLPVPADYVLGAGDELGIRAWGNVEIDYRTTVDRNGQISLPRVGTVTVAGLRAGEVEDHLRAQISRVFKGFSLSVTLGQLRTTQIFVVGQASRPGTYTVSSLATLINAVFASGGPGPNGSMRRVQLKRGTAVVTELDLYDFIVNGDKSRDVRLQSGDTIVYLPAGPRVAVLGAVETAAVFELKPGGSPLGEVLALAGGNRANADAHRAQLERIDSSNHAAPRVVQALDLSVASQTMLRDGDVLTLFPVRPQFANAVTLRGNVAEPLRHPYSPGMRISQLIPEREALVTRDYYVRKNRLVQYLDPRVQAQAESAWSQATSALPAPPATRPAAPGTATPQPATVPPGTRRPDLYGPTRNLEQRRASIGEAEQTVRNLVDEPNWEYATVERFDPERIATQLLPFNLGRAILQKDPEHDLVLQPGDIVTIFGSKDIRRPQARGTRLVRVEGEVDRPGVYQLQPGETLRSLVARAGGVTGQAYLYGTEFSRESTRRKQREALTDAVRRLESSLASAGAQRAANLSGTDAVAAMRLQAIEEEARRAQLDRLRALQPNGRIALELEPAINRLEDLPDLPLEDGDALFIPTRPGFVFAVGAVANDNALLWRAGRTVRQYLLAAGVLPEADEANIFLIRADGSVVHNRDSRDWFGRNRLESLVLAPGDTLVVPDRVDRETTWNAFARGAKDWTQILANFGISVAAFRTLRQ